MAGFDHAVRPQPPRLSGLPWIGRAWALTRNPLEVFIEGYLRCGPLFSVVAAGRGMLVMAGIEANTFVAKHEDDCLTAREHYRWFGRELGSEDFVLSLDGERHRHMRKTLRPGYSRQNVVERLPLMMATADAVTDEWRPGQTIDVARDVRRIVIDQLGLVLGGRKAGVIVDDLWRMLDTLLRVTAVRSVPSVMLWDPRFRRARQRVRDFVVAVIAEHRRVPAQERERDHIDDLIDAVDERGTPLASEAVETAALGPFVAGIDTVANTVAFMLYALHRHPAVLERVREEVDIAFAAGAPDFDGLRGLQTLHGAAMETLRMFPVTPAVVRTTTRAVEFAGFEIAANTNLIIAHCVTHYLPEFFADPYRFDPDRFLEPRREHRKRANAFVPFAVGPHTCLGAGIAEAQVALDVARIIHRFRLELDPPDYVVGAVGSPIARPIGLRFRVLEQRSVAESTAGRAESAPG